MYMCNIYIYIYIYTHIEVGERPSYFGSSRHAVSDRKFNSQNEYMQVVYIIIINDTNKTNNDNNHNGFAK